MKRRLFIGALLATLSITANAQMSPESYSATHKDSCWHFTLDYDMPKLGSKNGMVVVTHICTPDTCVSSATRHIQGKKYSKKYERRYGSLPALTETGKHCCTLAVPEEAINDTVYAITYCEYSNLKETDFFCDTLAICLPEAPPLSCHRVKEQCSYADVLSYEYPYLKNIRYYTPLKGENAAEMGVTPHIVRYTTNSDKLNPEYLDNAMNIEELMLLIDEVLADSSTRLESVQFVGYTSPDGSEKNSTGLGHARAVAMREHIRKHHNMPDSIFEIADGGQNWNMVYDNIMDIDPDEGESLVERLINEPDPQKRERILKRFDNGRLYTTLLEKYFPAHRIACCTGIYYSNSPDSTAMALNEIIDQLANDPTPDYSKILEELKQYRNDPRVLNLEGVIEYRRHHRHAAEQAFREAAQLGDEQAAVNLQIMENNKNR